MKRVIWNEKAREFVRALDSELKIEIVALLMMLQSGEVLGSPQSKPMKSIHSNAYELRIRDRSGIYRVIYVLWVENKILIPHAFNKKTQKTSKKEIELSIKRLKEMLNEDI